MLIYYVACSFTSSLTGKVCFGGLVALLAGLFRDVEAPTKATLLLIVIQKIVLSLGEECCNIHLQARSKSFHVNKTNVSGEF